ncbi:cysteine dioxygenase family protein [Streptomyces sp. NPDC006743]|uniref:cysteine dioxygenase family protein n=1 Tax=Streptomyces sp. NPDC006743 TaxID=3154480 RepID=UPI003454EAAE
MTTTDVRTRRATTPRLDRLVQEVREAVRQNLPGERTAHLVARRLAPHLGAGDLLTDAQCEGSADRYRQHVLHVEEDGGFSVVALVWLPGQRTSVHDHVSWCVTGVHEGREHERRYRLTGEGAAARLVATEEVVNERGDVCGFAPPGDIHRVWNGGTGKAVSLHIYGADIDRLGSSVRRVYEPPADER